MKLLLQRLLFLREDSEDYPVVSLVEIGHSTGENLIEPAGFFGWNYDNRC